MKLQTVVSQRSRTSSSRASDRSVDLILFIFMVLVFGPVIGLHVGYAVIGGNAAQVGEPTKSIAKTTELMVAARQD